MLELMKELGFIPESRALKLYNLNGSVVGERFDKVTYLRENLASFTLETEEPVYVEAGRFIPMLPFIRTAKHFPNYLQVILRNGSEYRFPYLDIEFERPEIPDDVTPKVVLSGELDFSTLKKTTLQNLVKPEMRCVYVDTEGAVSCNFLQGTVDNSIRATEPILLSPDLMGYIGSGNCSIIKAGEILYYKGETGNQVWAPDSSFDVVEEGEVPWYLSIRQSALSFPEDSFFAIPQDIEESIKRLQLFGTEAEFCSDRIKVDDNFEFCSLPTANGSVFTLEEVSSVISLGKEIGFTEDTMYLRNGSVIVLVSCKEEE